MLKRNSHLNTQMFNWVLYLYSLLLDVSPSFTFCPPPLLPVLPKGLNRILRGGRFFFRGDRGRNCIAPFAHYSASPEFFSAPPNIFSASDKIDPGHAAPLRVLTIVKKIKKLIQKVIFYSKWNKTYHKDFLTT